jgi:hypothetical protein
MKAAVFSSTPTPHARGREGHRGAQAALAAALAEVLVDDQPRRHAEPGGHAHHPGARAVPRPAAGDHVLAQEARPALVPAMGSASSVNRRRSRRALAVYPSTSASRTWSPR